MKLKIILIPFLFIVGGASAQSYNIGVLGTPANGSIVSGVSVISGYHCTSKNIEVFIDGVYFGKAGAGTQVLGTQGVCGRTDTGYSFLYNFSNLANGQHTISVRADGVHLATNTVTSVKSGGEQFLTGASKQTKIPDFPHAGQVATLEWVQSYQNFMVTGIGDTANDLSGLNGTYVQNASISTSGSSCNFYNFVTGNQTFIITVGAKVTSPNVVALYATPETFTNICLYALTRNAGNSATGYGLDGSVACDSSTAAVPVVATGIIKAGNGKSISGTITTTFPGCTHTAVLN